MAMVTLTSTCNTSLLQTSSLDYNNNNNLRDASFSTYLNSTEETFVHKLAESNRNLSPIITTQENNQNLESKKEDDAEIGVFGAEKYFNGVMDEKSTKIANTSARKYQYMKDERVDIEPAKPKLQHGTPSVQSESSWNSQSALLQNVPRNPSQRKTNKVHRKSFLAGLGCKCYCYDKDSVDIDEHVGEISFKRSDNRLVQGKVNTKEPIKTGLEHLDAVHNKPLKEVRVKEDLGLSIENCFTFPTTNSGSGNLPVKMHFQEEELKLPRKSLEVFGSPVLDKSSKSLSLERRLTMLSWDATPRVEDINCSATSGGIYNDSESDASSDLFEIESLTGKGNPFLATSGCVTPTTCYAPSEASIEWSVVTASAADFSVMSDSEELRPPTTTPSPIKSVLTSSNAKTRTSKEMQRRRPSILLGCKSQKAVRVAGEAYRTNERANFDPRMRRVSDSFMPVTRFQAETKLTGFDFRHRQHALAATRSPPRSHSPRSSHLLYIQ